VSVVIVTWRARDKVLRCLDALERHAGIDHEVIVVDDGSADGTSEAVRAQFPEVSVLAQPHNRGLVAGRNAALPLRKGRFTLMLDADTEITPGALPTLVTALHDEPSVGIVAPKLAYPDGSLQLSCRRFPPLLLPFLRRGPYPRVNPDPRQHRIHLMKDFDHSHSRPVVWAIGAAQMWRSELTERMGIYDSRISSYGGEDLDWCLRAWAQGLAVRYVPTACIIHHFQQATRQSPYGRASFRALRDFYYLQLKHRRLRNDPLLRAAME
jgi:GT2 family glycosyltransferase